MNGFLLFVGEEWVFVFSIAGFIITLLALLLTVIFLKEHKRTKIVVITLLSIITLVCAISAISYIVLKNTDTPSTSDTANEEQPSDSESSDDSSTDENSSNSDSTTPTMLKLYAEPSTETAKWGYVDGDDNIVIPYIYDWADDFIDGYAAVSLNYRWGFIDMSGNEMIAFDYNGAWSFIDGLAPVFNGDKWGFIDETGNVKIPFKYAKISRTYINGKQVYIDENDNVIDYENETSSTSSSSSSSLKPTLSSTPSNVPVSGDVISVPVRDFIQSYVSAYRNGSKLTVTINKDLLTLIENTEYPFDWGLQLKDNLNDTDKVGEYVIELMLSVNEDGTIIETDSCILQAEDGSKVIVKKHLTDVSADFDGENYVVTCDIANDYIDFDKICISRQFYY